MSTWNKLLSFKNWAEFILLTTKARHFYLVIVAGFIAAFYVVTFVLLLNIVNHLESPIEAEQQHIVKEQQITINERMAQ